MKAELLWRCGVKGTELHTDNNREENDSEAIRSERTGVLPRLGQGPLQHQGNVRDALRANVTEKLADIRLAAHLGNMGRK